jgi:hypothetical protein
VNTAFLRRHAWLPLALLLGAVLSPGLSERPPRADAEPPFELPAAAASGPDPVLLEAYEARPLWPGEAAPGRAPGRIPGPGSSAVAAPSSVPAPWTLMAVQIDAGQARALLVRGTGAQREELLVAEQERLPEGEQVSQISASRVHLQPAQDAAEPIILKLYEDIDP